MRAPITLLNDTATHLWKLFVYPRTIDPIKQTTKIVVPIQTANPLEYKYVPTRPKRAQGSATRRSAYVNTDFQAGISLLFSGGVVINSAGVTGLAALRYTKLTATIIRPEMIDVNSNPIV